MPLSTKEISRINGLADAAAKKILADPRSKGLLKKTRRVPAASLGTSAVRKSSSMFTFETEKVYEFSFKTGAPSLFYRVRKTRENAIYNMGPVYNLVSDSEGVIGKLFRVRPVEMMGVVNWKSDKTKRNVPVSIRATRKRTTE